MYNITEPEKIALRSNVRVEHIRGTCGEFSFTDDDVLDLSYSNRCSNTDDISFGLAFIGQISIVFCGTRVHSLSRGFFDRRVIQLEWGFEYQDENDETQTSWIPIGTFYTASAEWSDHTVTVVANDVISKLDKAFGGTQTRTNKLGVLAAFACQMCGVTWGMTTAETDALPNGTEYLTLYDKNDIETWRDYLAWLASTAGGYLTADRNGNVVIRSLIQQGDSDQWGAGQRIAGAIFADYDTSYSGISYLDIAQNKKVEYNGSTLMSDSLYIQMGANPFIQGNSRALYTLAQGTRIMRYVPSTVSLMSNMIYDLGDEIRNTGGLLGAENAITRIMAIDWQYKGVTQYKCFGANPYLQAGKSKTDKALSALRDSSKADLIQFTKYVNSAELTIGDSEVQVADVRFGLVETRDVEEWAELKFTATGNAKITIRYYLDDVLIEEYSPEETWNTGGGLWVVGEVLNYKSAIEQEDVIHTDNYHYHLNSIASSIPHTWKITITADEGEITIPVGGLHVVLWAPGMLGENEWNGIIQASDNLPFLPFEPLSLFGNLTDTATFNTEETKSIITENGSNLITEDGNNLMT